MLWLKRAAAVMVVALILVSVCSTCFAAKSSSGSKVYVPANILKGAAITSGRAFYKSSVPETTLAGIRLGRPAKEILAKWGNPSRVVIGTVQAQGPEQMPGMLGGPAYMPPSPSPYGDTMGPMNSRGPSLAELYGAPTPNTLPGLPGLPGAPGTSPGTTGQSQILTQEEVTWTYDLQNGITLEFIITDGLITQITAGGIGPWGLSKTRTGLQLGDTYKLVLWVSGYPESQEYAGRFLRARYVTNNRVLYTFLDNKLVGVTIALVSEEIQR